VAQCLITYQNSHRPQDLWHFVTPDHRTASLWIQMKSGDNRDMTRVEESVESFIQSNPPPAGLTHRWFGLTYINVIWQEKMVSGMVRSLLGSFGVVLVMMILLFRSPLWGVLSMIPLALSIALIYGVVGWIGKDYDMPVAILSSLSLGLAVDYAIHFLARSRALYDPGKKWGGTVGSVFGEPARAITRNAIVVGVGFLPLLAAPLVPYQTVGIFIASILLTAGAASLAILPALIRVLETNLFRER
jgi:predicted RND superfamily exporter protein